MGLPVGRFLRKVALPTLLPVIGSAIDAAYESTKNRRVTAAETGGGGSLDSRLEAYLRDVNARINADRRTAPTNWTPILLGLGGLLVVGLIVRR